jgi:TPR repeat protein
MLAKTRWMTLALLLSAAVFSPAGAIAAPAASPTVSAPSDEQALFKRLRANPYFAPLTDEQLRQHPLPPGVASWQEFLDMQDRLAATPAPKPSPRIKVRSEFHDAPNEVLDRKVLARATAGDAAAQAQVGIWSLYGWGKLIPLDERAAVKWHRLAAEQRHRVSIGFMSAFYESGNTAVDRDRAEALKWALILKAVEQEARADVRETDARIARIKGEMTPREIAEGEARARAWLASHPARAKR